MLDVKQVRLQAEGVHIVETLQTDPQMSRHAGGLVKGVDAAALAEVVPGRLGAELVEPSFTNSMQIDRRIDTPPQHAGQGG
jgi:hypothetical protein